MKMDKEVFSSSFAKIYPEDYTIYSTNKSLENAFINIIDESEITVITHQKIESYLDQSCHWIRIGITIKAPPESKWIASILTAEFAKNNLSIVPIASFSKANIFVQKSDIEVWKKCLKNLGISYS